MIFMNMSSSNNSKLPLSKNKQQKHGLHCIENAFGYLIHIRFISSLSKCYHNILNKLLYSFYLKATSYQILEHEKLLGAYIWSGLCYWVQPY
jgi:hypothetical protein